EEHAFGDDRTLKVPGIVPKLSDTPGQTRWLGPKLGEHNEQVLAGLGYSAEEIQQMKDGGVI
ncbi:MAG: CoA transferase, partial [Gammaproteobacteria bacterium]